jgi:hypothetical protein
MKSNSNKMNLATKRKKQQILARFQARKKMQLAIARVGMQAALGSSQILHIMSQPIHRHLQPGNGGHQLVAQRARGSGKTFAQGGLVSHSDPAAAVVPDGIISRHWCPDPDLATRILLDRTWQALDLRLQILAENCSDPDKAARIEQKRAVMASLHSGIQGLAKTMKQLSQASQFLHEAQKRIRMKNRKGHHRTCRTKTKNNFQP